MSKLVIHMMEELSICQSWGRGHRVKVESNERVSLRAPWVVGGDVSNVTPNVNQIRLWFWLRLERFLAKVRRRADKKAQPICCREP